MAMKCVVFVAMFLQIIGNVESVNFEIQFGVDDDCKASVGFKQIRRESMTAMSNGKYAVTEARILYVDDSGKIKGNAGCGVPRDPSCSFVGTTAPNQFVMIAVALDSTSFEDQDVNYMYNEKTSQMGKLDRPSDTPVPIHDLSNFIYPTRINVDGNTVRINRCDNIKDVIFGHGYFIKKIAGRLGKDDGWHNMYYQPFSAQGYLITG